jgi:hypothetical protein
MCESIPEDYASEKMGETVNEAQKKSLVKLGEIYLTKLASYLLKILNNVEDCKMMKMRKRF